ncbi:MAG TPA: hypothetical protein VF315_08785, partial [Steroidobacteraceae bacterium]
MGYFERLAEAEEWLTLVREIYPGAWAGEAPGRRLRAEHKPAAQTAPRFAPSAPPQAPRFVPVLQAQHPPDPQEPQATVAPSADTTSRATESTVASKSPPAPSQAPAVRATAQLAATSPTVSAAPAPTSAAVAPRTADKPQSAGAVRATPSHGKQPSEAAAKPPSAAPQGQRTTPKTGPNAPPILPKSNVREVLAALDGAREKPGKAASAPAAAKAPARAARANAAPENAQDAQTREMPALAAKLAMLEPVGEPASLSDTQVLRMLENRRDEKSGAAAEPVPRSTAAQGEIRLLRPEDAGTMQELRKDLTQVSFAVQLDWSVKPIDLTRVPPLAIFSAYTLYTVEGNREGRKWYGLRLGFFSDSTSAKQVAFYVRSEFASVAVVPIGAQERKRASDDGRLSPSAIGPRRPTEAAPEEFKLLDDAVPREAPTRANSGGSAPARTAKQAPTAARSAPPSASRKAPRRKSSKASDAADRLEETLEILGANQLTIDNGRGERINDTGVRHLEVRVDKRTFTFATLLDRLADKLGRG